MAKIWDILPPQPKKAPSPKKAATKRRTLSVWYLLILIIFSFVFVFGGSWAKLKYFDSSPTKSASPSLSPTAETTKTKGNLSIKILNSTGKFEEMTKVRDVLTKNGFSVSSTETAVNTYDSTIVYYNPNSASIEKYAQEIAGLLSSYSAKTQKFSQSSSYDIAVIIGGKF